MGFDLWPSAHESGTLTQELNCSLLLDYKFEIPTCDCDYFSSLDKELYLFLSTAP
jgi:hypothetical protein